MTAVPPHPRPLLAACAIALALCGPACAQPGVEGVAGLQAREAKLHDALAHSPFGRPLLLHASASDSAPRGQVDAVVDHPFDEVAAALKPARSWCTVILLQTNMKRCQVDGDGPQQQVEVGVTRRYTDPVSEAQTVDFRYRVLAAQPQYLAVTLSAANGPLGTRDYSLRFEAAPAGAGKTFVHFAYAYDNGLMASLATQAYLASSGRDKVGFSVVGHDANGHPRYVGGLQGVAERNTMRYFLAIDALLDTQRVPAQQRLDALLREFHDALERYPAQLHETALPAYLQMKRREMGRA